MHKLVQPLQPYADPRLQALADELAGAHRLLRRAARSVPRADLYRRPAPEEWTVAEVLAHAANLQTYYSYEARKVCQHPGVAIVGRSAEAPFRRGPIQRHAGDSRGRLLERVEEGRQDILDLLAELAPEDLEKRCHHRNGLQVTVEELLRRFVIGHLRTHAEQIAQARQALT